MQTKKAVDLDHLTEAVWEDLAYIEGKGMSLVWVQKEYFPWWQKLRYGSEMIARKDAEIEREENIRDYRVLASETPNFSIDFVQGPLSGRTHPHGFKEYLEFMLKKESWRGRHPEDIPAADIPSAYMFFDKSEFSQEQIDYFSSPRFSLERYINFDSANIELKSEGFFGDLDGRLSIQEIPEAEELIKIIVQFSNSQNIIFKGEGIKDKKVIEQLRNFKLNLEAAYGIAAAGCGGINIGSYHYGT